MKNSYNVMLKFNSNRKNTVEEEIGILLYKFSLKKGINKNLNGKKTILSISSAA